MSKSLTSASISQLDRKDIRRKITVTLGSTNITPYVISYNYQFDTTFSI
ncbi:unnamed protein product, partial [marine sediment metagenome]